MRGGQQINQNEKRPHCITLRALGLDFSKILDKGVYLKE